MIVVYTDFFSEPQWSPVLLSVMQWLLIVFCLALLSALLANHLRDDTDIIRNYRHTFGHVE